MYKKILAFDTSMDGCSVSLLKNNVVSHILKFCKKNHTEKILPMIQDLLYQLQINVHELDMIVFSRGPGHFTGIRIAFCIAETFTIGNKAKSIGISTLAVIAEQAWRKYKSQKVLVAMHASKNKIYWAEYIRNIDGIWKGGNTESCITIKRANTRVQELSDIWTTVGSAWAYVTSKPQFLSTEIFFPNSQDLLQLALSLKYNPSYFIKNKFPIYLHEIL